MGDNGRGGLVVVVAVEVEVAYGIGLGSSGTFGMTAELRWDREWERELVNGIDGRGIMLRVLVVVGGHGKARRCY